MAKYFFSDYENFECIAERCPSTCCAKWQICPDDEWVSRYLAGGELRERAKRSLRGREGSYRFALKDGRCPFLNDENLCDLIKNGSQKDLCTVCAEHPRFRVLIGGDEVYYLSLSCPVAAELFLNRSQSGRVALQAMEKQESEQFYFDSAEDYYDIAAQKAKAFWEAVKNASGFSCAAALNSTYSACEYLGDGAVFYTQSDEDIKRGRDELAKTQLVENLFVYFSFVFYRYNKSVFNAAACSALAILACVGKGVDCKRAIYDYCTQIEHSSRNEKTVVSRSLAPLTKNALARLLKMD